jgi:hypothetical protein
MSDSVSVDKQLEGILEEFKRSKLRPKIEKGLDVSAEVIKRNLEAAVGEGDSYPHFSRSWFVKKDYQGVRYVKNSKKVGGTDKKGNSKQVPLAAYLEHAVSSPHKGFIKRTVRQSKEQAINAFKDVFSKGE